MTAQQCRLLAVTVFALAVVATVQCFGALTDEAWVEEQTTFIVVRTQGLLGVSLAVSLIMATAFIRGADRG